MKTKWRWTSCGVMACALGLALLQTSCDNKRAPSVLIIAVDRLPFHLSLCSRDDDEQKSGFATLCQESIRFTHAMTPSTLSAPALASIVTGFYPYQHGVRFNSASGLSPRFETFAEAAVKKGYRTAFFSGGPPLWRRSGLHQGFEIFDDLVNFSSGRLFRPLQDSAKVFTDWLSNEVGDDAFASVLYAPDLNFTDTVTESMSGELRNLSYESQIEELEETLDEVFRHLKSRNRWDDTIIIVAGLNGREETLRDADIESTNLNSEVTQISLFIKPARKPRDEAIRWTVDRNVSLADVGRTLMEMMGAAVPNEKDLNFPLTSLSSVLESSQPNWPEDRPILMENAWSAWQGLTGIRAAVLRSQELTIYDSPPQVYNTLTDRFETMPLSPGNVDGSILANLRRKDFRPWAPPGNALRKTLRISPLNWLSPLRSPILHRELKDLALNEFAHPRILRWAAQSALEQKDWPLLRTLGHKMGRHDWSAVAERNLSKKIELKDPCLALLEKRFASRDEMKLCPDELFMSLYRLKLARRPGSGVPDRDRDYTRRQFQQAWEEAQIDLRILKANAAMGLLWLPLTAEEKVPSRTALALALPEFRGLLSK